MLLSMWGNQNNHRLMLAGVKWYSYFGKQFRSVLKWKFYHENQQSVHKRLHQHYSKQLETKNNPNVHQPMSGWTKCGKCIQWNIILQSEGTHYWYIQHKPWKHYAKKSDTDDYIHNTYCLIPHIWSFQKRQRCRDQKKIHGYLGSELGAGIDPNCN